MKLDLNRNSFTLIEILLALAILGIGLVSILSIFAVGVNSAKRAIDITWAGLASQMTLENFKQQGYANLSTGSQTLSDLTDYNGNTIFYYTAFTRDITVTDITDPNGVGSDYISNLRQIELTVEYANNNKEIARFITYITKYDP